MTAADLDKKLRKGYDAVRTQLSDDEEIAVCVPGAGLVGIGRQAIFATETRAFVYKRGILTGNTFGAQLNTYELRQITAVDVNVGLMFCSVVLRSGGDREVDNSPLQAGRRGRSLTDLTNTADYAPNAISFDRPDRKAVEIAVAELRALISRRQQPADPFDDQLSKSSDLEATNRGGPASIPDRIRELTVLRDDGVINTDEYEAKKAELLRQL